MSLDTSRQSGLVPAPLRYDGAVIIGAGAIGSHVAELLARMAWQYVTVFDFDAAESHNYPGQYLAPAAGASLKVDALREALEWIGADLNGWSFRWERFGPHTELPPALLYISAADTVEARRDLAAALPAGAIMLDFRMRPEDAACLFVSRNPRYRAMTQDAYLSDLDGTVFEADPACGPRAMPATAKAIVALAVGHLVAVFGGRATLHKRLDLNLAAGEVMTVD